VRGHAALVQKNKTFYRQGLDLLPKGFASLPIRLRVAFLGMEGFFYAATPTVASRVPLGSG